MSLADERPGRITLLPNEVIKRQSVEATRREAEKTRAAKVIADATGLFRVPTVLAVDDTQMSLERIDGLVSVRSLLAKDGAERLMLRVAAASVAIHERLVLDTTFEVPMTGAFAVANPVGLHGDFNPYNVMVCRETDELVVLDWSCPVWVQPEAMMGSASFDLALFGMNLFLQRPFDPDPVPNPERLLDVLLTEYIRLAKNPPPDFVQTARILARLWRSTQFERKNFRYLLTRAPTFVRYSRYLSRLTLSLGQPL
jgi:hypothetical protein